MARVFMDPDGVDLAATKFEQLADELDDRATAIAETLAEVCRSSTAPAKARGAADLFRQIATEMRQRVELVRQADTGGGLGAFGDLFITMGLNWESGFWPEQGAELAQRLNHLEHFNKKAGEEFHAVATELARHRRHPAYAAAFWASLDPPVADMLPSYLASTGADTARADLRAFSRSLGVALSRPDPTGALTAITERFTQPPDHLGQAWNRGALLAYGRYPPEWLTRVARINVLDQFAAGLGPNDTLTGANGNDANALGLPADTLAVYLGALGHHPTAARDALTPTAEGEPTRADTIRNMLTYNQIAGDSDAVADNLGDALTASTGTNDEQIGAHSPEAAQFAFDTITALAGNQADVPWAIKDSLGQIAASYAPEITIGASIADATFRSSAISAPANFTPIAGLTPSFYLDLGDTYRYLKTFASDDRFSAPFDEAMGTIQAEILPMATRADLEAIQAGGLDPRHADEAAYALGSVAGLQYEAQRVVRGDMDQADKEARELVGTILTLGVNKSIGATASPGAALPAKAAWAVTKYAARRGIKHITGAPAATRVDQVEATNDQMILGAQYEVAGMLYTAGWPNPAPPPPSILGPEGQLKPYAELAVHPAALRDFSGWLDSTDTGAGSLDKKTEDLASRLNYGNSLAATEAGVIENRSTG